MSAVRAGQLLAQAADKSVVSRLVEWFTQSKWTHVSLVIDEATLIESMFPMGVREVPLADRLAELTSAGQDYEFLDIPELDDATRQAIVAGARTFLGRRYDYLQCIMFGLFGRFVKDGPLRVICSRFITASAELASVNIFQGVTLPITISPARREGIGQGYCVPVDIVEHSRYEPVAA